MTQFVASNIAFLALTLLMRTTSAQLLDANKLFVVGGSSALYDVEVVDLSLSQQQNCPKPADYTFAGMGSVGTYIGGSIMVCGGGDFELPLSQCYNYNIESDSWQETVSMEQIRYFAAAVQLSDNKWLVTGGRESNQISSELASTEMYTVGEGFAPFVDLPERKDSHNLVKINDTHIMLLGGFPTKYKTWMLNLETEMWTSLPDLPKGTSHTQAGLVTHSDGRKEVVVAAGFDVNATQIFSLDSLTWRLGKEFPANKLYSASSVQKGDSFLIVSGSVMAEVGGGFRHEIYQYDVDMEEFMVLPQKVESSRDFFAAFLVPNDLFNCSE